MNKPNLITFKVDDALALALQGVPNRSEFIRDALLAALENTCPLCRGTGFLGVEQRRHWETFARSHPLRECQSCHAWLPVCLEHHEQGAVECR